MKNYLICAAVWIAGMHNLIAGDTKPLHDGYTWESSPKPTQLSEKEKDEPAIIIFDKRLVEYLYDAEGNLQKYYIRHKRMMANTTERVNSINKIKVSTYGVQEMIAFKARAIAANGKVTELPESSIKEVNNEEEGQFKLAAIEGLEAGAEVEYYFIMNVGADYFDNEYMQYEEPARNIQFELRSPENLQFETQIYNGEAVTTDTVADGQRILTITMKDVPGLDGEKYMFYSANLARVEYKLAYNTNRENTRILTWTDAGKRYYEMINTVTKDDIKAAKKLLKTINAPEGGGKETIRAIESYIKGNFAVQNAFSYQGESISSIVKTRLASKLGITQLYVLLLKEAGIENEVVVTSDRTEMPFDPKFDTWNYLREVFLYLPEEDLYLAPADPVCRIGYIPAEYTDNDAIFISSLTLGGAETGLAAVKRIPVLYADEHYHNMTADVSFTEEMDGAKMKVVHTLSGYPAMDIRPVYHILPDDKKKELATSFLQLGAADAKVDNIKVNNWDVATAEVEKPFILEGDVTLDDLLENANNKYLVKVGNLIGEQAEMYQEKPRQKPAQLEYPHGYHRILKIHIPEGYKVTGLDALKMKHVYGGSADKPDMRFVSDYTLEGNLLTIDIKENYNKTFYPVASYEQFREVINAAANFNKVTLVLTK